MPGKSRHGKGKHPHHSKKSKAIQRRQAGVIQQQPDSATAAPAAPVQPAPVPTAAATPKVRTAQYPYITSELRRIGILAGIILVILIVLSIVL